MLTIRNGDQNKAAIIEYIFGCEEEFSGAAKEYNNLLKSIKRELSKNAKYAAEDVDVTHQFLTMYELASGCTFVLNEMLQSLKHLHKPLKDRQSEVANV